MIQLPENFDSIFRYIVVVSQRAEQIINGAKPRTDSRHAKPTLVAKTDVDSGEVPWRVLTQEELDARRQEIVEQFRAEVGGAEGVAEGEEQIRDVLPTRAVTIDPQAPAGEEGGERDDELSRLQRLLGLAGGEAHSDLLEDEDDDEEATDVDLEDLTAFEEGDDDAGEEE